MNQEEKSLFERAVLGVRADLPDANLTEASARRVADTLGISTSTEVLQRIIHSCDDVQRLFGAYRAGALSEARSVLVSSHLRECGICLRKFRQGSEGAVVDWSAPSVVSARRPRIGWSWAFATAILLVFGVVLYRTYWAIPVGVRAEVQTVDGTAYLISGNTDQPARPGTELREGEQLRTGGSSRAVLRLADGSIVEINQRSVLNVGERGQNTTVSLHHGAVIVQAAHRSSGHLYVRTPDCRVAVKGTVFSVDTGLKGSRVAVLKGSVQVVHAGIHSLLQPGQQLATSESLAPEPLEQQIAWSPNRNQYIGLLAELSNIQHQIAQVPFPQPRYGSDLLARVPKDTLLYISVPNLGQYLSQANNVFQDQLSQSPQLQQWWSKTHGNNPNALNDAVAKIYDLSQYLGNEVVVVGFGNEKQSGLAVIADVQRSGLEQEMKQLLSQDPKQLVVLDPATLATASMNTKTGGHGYVLVRDHEVVFSKTLECLRQVNAQLNAGSSGFAAGDFGKQIGAAYDRGTGIILAANLHAMIQSKINQEARTGNKGLAIESTGLNGLQYLIAEHREVNGLPQNHLNVEFAGMRQRIPSWLASPAPMASLDFVSPHASVAVGVLTKDPAAIADDLMQIATEEKGKTVDWNDLDSKLQVSVRNDLLANLSGEFVVALDGPVLPTPSWKMVVGVNNPGALEAAFERLTTAIGSQLKGHRAHPLIIESSTDEGRRMYDMRDSKSGNILAYYTFADGYMIVAPSRALVADALHSHATGDSLARSASFRALLPRDENENYSAVGYQNLGPQLTPLLAQSDGETANALRKLAADSHPTVICAWGHKDRIEVASDSSLFGFDFFTLGAALHRNKTDTLSVNR